MHFAQASSCLSEDCLEFTVWLLGFFTKTIHSLRWNLWHSFESCEFMVRNKRDTTEKGQKLVKKIQLLLMETVMSNWFICFWKSDVMKKTSLKSFFLYFRLTIKTFIEVNCYPKFQLTRNLVFLKENAQFKNPQIFSFQGLQRTQFYERFRRLRKHSEKFREVLTIVNGCHFPQRPYSSSFRCSSSHRNCIRPVFVKWGYSIICGAKPKIFDTLWFVSVTMAKTFVIPMDCVTDQNAIDFIFWNCVVPLHIDWSGAGASAGNNFWTNARSYASWKWEDLVKDNAEVKSTESLCSLVMRRGQSIPDTNNLTLYLSSTKWSPDISKQKSWLKYFIPINPWGNFEAHRCRYTIYVPTIFAL